MQFLFALLSNCFLACATVPAIAQTGVPVTTKKADAPITSKPSKVATSKTGDRTAADIVASAGLPADTPGPLASNTILVRIRYKQELGYNEDHDTYGDKGPFSCTAFEVRTTVLDRSSPGAFGVERRAGSINPNEPMKAGDGLYSCWFTISDLPFRQAIKVSGTVRDRPRYLSERWMGGSQPQPPRGGQRTVLGSRGVTLTAQQTSALVDMEMVYRPVVTPPE